MALNFSRMFGAASGDPRAGQVRCALEVCGGGQLMLVPATERGTLCTLALQWCELQVRNDTASGNLNLKGLAEKERN